MSNIKLTTFSSRFSLGLPAWAFPQWRGLYFPQTLSPLSGYGSVFNTVEGNTTFYATPDEGTVKKWCQDLANRQFDFCFKLPKFITHDNRYSVNDLTGFFRRLAPLENHLGPFLVQFPATVGPKHVQEIAGLLEVLPSAYDYVVEVRHPDFFPTHPALDTLLMDQNLSRVILDTRALYRGDRRHPEVLQAFHEKPDVPVPEEFVGQLRFVRLVLHPDIVSNETYIDYWAGRVAGQLESGRQCYVMIHCPNNVHCPELAKKFHTALGQRLAPGQINPFPPWPVPQQAQLI